MLGKLLLLTLCILASSYFGYLAIIGLFAGGWFAVLGLCAAALGTVIWVLAIDTLFPLGDNDEGF